MLSLGVAVAQFWPDYSSILMVLGIFLVGQFLEGNVLAPKLVGESVGLHPVWLIFALLAFGYLFGFVGSDGGGAAGRHHRRARALCAAALPGKFALYRRVGRGLNAIVRLSVRVSSCSRSIMPKASRARISCAGRRTRRRLTLIERWPDWPDRIVVLIGPEGSGKSHLAAIWAEARARACWRQSCSDDGRPAGGFRHRRAGARGSGVRRARRARAVPSAQSGARGGRLCAASPRARRCRPFRWRSAISPRACARCRV